MKSDAEVLKEIGLLLEDKSGQQRSRDQVVGLLNRRIDCEPRMLVDLNWTNFMQTFKRT